MNEKLKPFLCLQEIDSERHRLRKAIDQEEARREEPRKKAAQAKAAAATSEALRLAAERHLQDGQLRLKVEEEKLAKLEKQMLTLSSGREYKTMEHQIRGKKADMSLIEDEILKFMEQADGARAQAAAAQEAHEKAEAAVRAVEAAVEAATAAHRARLAALDVEAATAEKACDREILGRYQALLGRRNGLALAAVQNRVCQGCYTSITPHEENKLLGGQILECGNCQRLMYLKSA